MNATQGTNFNTTRVPLGVTPLVSSLGRVCRCQRFRYAALTVGLFMVAGSCLPIPPGQWRSVRLAKVLIRTAGSETVAYFRAPIDGTIELSLVFDQDARVGSDAGGIEPQWPLRVQVIVTNRSVATAATSRVVTSGMMTFANWHTPRTTLVLGRTGAVGSGVPVCRGDLYEVRMNVMVPVTWFTNQVDLFADWVQ
jgi:hypothetical protein